MSRIARKTGKTGKTGIHYIMLRGINRQDLFEDDEDRERFIKTLILNLCLVFFLKTKLLLSEGL